MARTPNFLPLLAMLLVLYGCHHSDDSRARLRQVLDTGQQQAEQQTAADPARQPHPNDPNPLRRKLGDLQIRELFFGVTQTQGDWMAYLPCSQAYAGLPVAGPNRIYLKRCPALQQVLLDKAHGAGFTDATAKDVFDPRISHAAAAQP